MKETTLRTSKNVSFDGISNVEAGYHRRQRKSIVVSLVLLAIALVLAAVMMLYGNTIYTPSEVWDALKEVEGSAVFTVKTLRLPRMLTAILAGFAFGMAGNTFQQLLGNPLASPDIIGVTSGASVAAVFGILVLKLPTGIVSLLAVISGLLVSCLIIGFSLLNCLEFFVFRKMKSSSTINHPLCGCESNVIQKKLPFRVQ